MKKYGIPIIMISAVKYWPFGEYIYFLQSFIGINIIIAGSFSIFAVNVERFIAIVYPLHHLTLLTLRRAQWITVTLWISASIVTLIHAINTHWDIWYLPYFNHCAFAGLDWVQSKLFSFLPFMMGFHVPYFITIILYLKIIAIFHHHKKQIEIPILVVVLKEIYELNKYSVLFLGLLWYSASWMDVFIYLWRNQQFRQQLKQLLKARVAK